MKLWVFGLLTGRGPLLPLLAFVLAGGLIFLLGARLARAADTIAEETGLGRLWVGSLLLAASTSLPEVLTNLVGTLLVGLTTTLPETVTTVSALRLGAPDLAVANVFGSVAFNLFTVLVLDLAYRPAPVLAAVSREHLLSILATMTCVTLGVIGIVTRVVRHPILVRVESALIVVTYLFTLWLLAAPLRDQARP
jgi:cation:H+ antiporter